MSDDVKRKKSAIRPQETVHRTTKDTSCAEPDKLGAKPRTRELSVVGALE